MPDRLAERFARFAEDVRTPPHRPVEVVRARGDHRRHRQAAIAVLAAVVVIVVVGTVVGASMARGTRALPPVSTPVPTAFPAGFRMPHDGEPGWARSDDPSVPDGFTSCDGTDVTVDHRVAAVTTIGPRVDDPAGRLIEQVLLYDSVLAAQTALASLYHAALVCHWSAGIGQDPFYAQPRLHAINQLTDVMAVGDVTLWHNALIVTYATSGKDIPFFSDDDGEYRIAGQLCATMHMCEPPKCVEPAPSPNSPVLKGCSPRTPVVGGTITFTLEPLPDPASASPGGISATPGPSANPAPTSS